MTNAPKKRVLSGRQISTGLILFNTELRLIPIITGTFVEALSGTGLSMTTGFGTGVIQ